MGACDFHHVLNHLMKKTAPWGVGCLVIDLFSLAAADNQSAVSQRAQMMGDGGTGHCALVISIPLSFFAGIGGASKAGVLVKGSNYLETLSKTRYVVFDKTGTLTQEVFVVSGIHHNELEDAKLLEYAALAECASSHPISKSLQKAYGREIGRERMRAIL